MSRTRRVVGIALALAGGLGVLKVGSGCATVLGVETDRYLLVADARGADAEVDAGPWGCLAEPLPIAPPGKVELSFVFSDVTSKTSTSAGNPIVGANVHACTKLDTGCANFFDDTTTDDAGVAILMVPGGFDGYYEVHASGFTPAILARPPQFVREQALQGMADLSLLSAGASLAGLTQDPNLSVAIVSALDCTSLTSGGIVFHVGNPGPGEKVVYLSNNLPSQSATQTDSFSGSALVFNVPPGTLSITAAFATTEITIRTVTALARVGWVTFVLVEPDQSTRTPPP